MPRIGFDGRTLASPAAGVRRYASELFGALAALRQDLTIVAVGASPSTPLPSGVERGPDAASLPTNAGWMLTGLPRAAARASLDLFHAPAYTAPFRAPRPLVVTIHDVSYERHPEWYPYRRDPIRRAFYRRSARAADRVVTDSTFSKEEIVAAYGLSPASIDVVPLAASAGFGPGPALPLPPGVPLRYILHVGDLHARRNVNILVKALTNVRATTAASEAGLVLAGVAREAPDAAAVAAPFVTFTGHTSEASLLALYRSAAALVYPSRYEGFGLPLVEAMACGVPVIASRASCIPEVTGGAAILVDPDDEQGWTTAIDRVLGDAATAGAMRQAGLRRAADFSWRRTAEATAEIYDRLLRRA